MLPDLVSNPGPLTHESGALPYIKTIVEKGEKLLLKSNFSSYPQYFYLLLSFYVRTGTRISLRDKRLFEITEVEIARVDFFFSCAEYF